MHNNSAIVININGSNNNSDLILDSSNAIIRNDNTELINSYVTSIQNYIQDQLNLLLTDTFRTNNNLTGEKGYYTNSVKLCWVGKPETFYNDISMHIPNEAKIFTHFSDSEKLNYILNFKDAYDNIIDVPLNLSESISKKIDYVNKCVPDKLKRSAQGNHTLGCINNSTLIDNSEPQTKLNMMGYGLKKYNKIYAYELTEMNYSVEIKPISGYVGTGTVQLDSSGNKYVQIDISDNINFDDFFLKSSTLHNIDNGNISFSGNSRRYLYIIPRLYYTVDINNLPVPAEPLVDLSDNSFVSNIFNGASINDNDKNFTITSPFLPEQGTVINVKGQNIITHKQ